MLDTASPSKGDQGDAAEVSSRPASAKPVVEQNTDRPRLKPIPEDEQVQETVQDPMELQLPPDIAQPLTEVCSAEIQVSLLPVMPAAQQTVKPAYRFCS